MVGANESPEAADIAARYRAVCDSIAQAEADAGREAGSVRLELAVKYQSPERVRAALDAGATLLGHNLIQQLAAGEEALTESAAPARRTHVIGHVQSNKAGKAMAWADCIETVDSLALAERLNRLRARQGAEASAAGDSDLGPFSIFLQVNSSGTDSQFGIPPAQVVNLAGQIAELEHVRIDGLMTIGAHTDHVADIAASFERVRILREQLNAAGLVSVRELSMGMTADMAIAIAEGSTIVRVGTAVFGPRPRP